MPIFLGDVEVTNVYLGETKISNMLLGEAEPLPTIPPPAASKNIFNTTWELGAYEWATGNKIDSSNFIRAVDLIAVEPNTNYVGSTNMGMPNNAIYFTKDKAWISYDNDGTLKARPYYVTPDNCYYMGLNLNVRKITVADITWTQVEKGTVATDYEPPNM